MVKVDTSFIREIQRKTDLRSRLEQLAEESSELSKAAIKVIRSSGESDSPTPVSKEQAWKDLLEEVADVVLCLIVLGISIPWDIVAQKARRWLGRIGEKEKKDGI